MRAAERGLKHPPADEHGAGQFDKNDLDSSSIMRFDYIVRKVMKICAKESNRFIESLERPSEGQDLDEDHIDLVWFFTLDSMFKIKAEQMKMLQKLRDQKTSRMNQLNFKDQAKIGSADE